MTKLSNWLIILLAGKRTVVINAVITGTLLIESQHKALIYRSNISYTHASN